MRKIKKYGTSFNPTLNQKKEIGYSSFSFDRFKKYVLNFNDLVETTRGGKTLIYVLGMIHDVYYQYDAREYKVSQNLSIDTFTNILSLVPLHLQKNGAKIEEDDKIIFDNGVTLDFS